MALPFNSQFCSCRPNVRRFLSALPSSAHLVVPIHALSARRSRKVAWKRTQVTGAVKNEDSKSSPQQPVTTDEEEPVWIRRERERQLQADSAGKDLPWPLYLVLSCLVAIAAVGSIFEFVDKNPIFGVVPPESPLWAPILGLFAFTGLPMAGFLFFKGVSEANKAAELQDKLDGFR